MIHNLAVWAILILFSLHVLIVGYMATLPKMRHSAYVLAWVTLAAFGAGLVVSTWL
jgi:hypothetical protein